MAREKNCTISPKIKMNKMNRVETIGISAISNWMGKSEWKWTLLFLWLVIVGLCGRRNEIESKREKNKNDEVNLRKNNFNGIA